MKTCPLGTPDLGREPAPDETTVCKFRHLLERHELGQRIFAEVNGYLNRHRLKIGTGTIVDATILAAHQEQDPVARRTYFATMKLQFGFSKVRFRGLAKNLDRFQTTCALINLCTAREPLEGLAQSRA